MSSTSSMRERYTVEQYLTSHRNNHSARRRRCFHPIEHFGFLTYTQAPNRTLIFREQRGRRRRRTRIVSRSMLNTRKDRVCQCSLAWFIVDRRSSTVAGRSANAHSSVVGRKIEFVVRTEVRPFQVKCTSR